MQESRDVYRHGGRSTQSDDICEELSLSIGDPIAVRFSSPRRATVTRSIARKERRALSGLPGW
jgi:hypothetical protein